MLDTIPDNNKAFYVFVINAILESKVVDRGTYDYYPYSEMQPICGSLLVERPCTFFKDIKHGAYKSSYGKWINAIGSLREVCVEERRHPAEVRQRHAGRQRGRQPAGGR